MTDGTRRTERYELIIIGAGQAGLAAGYWLAQRDIDFLILDANPRVGDSWRRRWDSLQLFTPARYSGLPGMPFPGDPYHLPSRDEVADYLEWYAQAFELPVRNNVRVSRVQRVDGVYEILADDRTFMADNVIVATGPFHVARIPAFSDEIDPAILQLHSSEYRRPGQLPDGDVLVAGAGNSGAQIALELAKSRRVTLAGRSVGSMRRRFLGRDVFDWLWHTVMKPGADSFLGRRLRQNILSTSDALIGMTEADLERGGVARAGRVTGVSDGIPVLADGSRVNVQSIIWSTGFRPDFSWIDAPVFEETGLPKHVRGVTSLPGLYFLGLRFQYRLNSSLVGGVGSDARYVVAHISGRYGHTREASSSPRLVPAGASIN